MDPLDLQIKRAALVAALAEGVLRVAFMDGGTRREVWYQTVPDLERAIAAIDREIAKASGPRVRKFLPTFETGFE